VVQVLEDPPGHFQAVGCQVLPVPLAQLTGQRLCRVGIVGWETMGKPQKTSFMVAFPHLYLFTGG